MVFYRRSVLPLVVLLAGIQTAQCQADPCTIGRTLADPHRSAEFVASTGDHLICDDFLPAGWYKFPVGRDMPTSCVPIYHCGTHSPVWLKGTHPTIGQGVVNREACVNYGLNPALFGGQTCCNEKINIRVKNCNGYYVYYLSRTAGCETAYCVGEKPVCAIGQQLTGNHSCTEKYPKLTQFPDLLPAEIVNGHVRYPCKVPYQLGQPDVAFDVTWTMDGQPLINPITGNPEKTTLTGNNRTAYLNADLLFKNLNKNLGCTVTSYHPSTHLIKSQPVPSNERFIGMNVSKARIVVDENGPEKEITITSTVPIPCHAHNPADCKLTIELKTNDTKDISTNACKYDLKFDPVTGTYKATIKVMATRDFLDDHDKTHNIEFRPVVDYHNPMWLHYIPPSVQVTTKDKGSGSCTGSADPHLYGLDHKTGYGLYDIGDYVFYRAKNRDCEIQIRTWDCGSGWQPCICGIVAKEGNDVVQLDVCEKLKGQTISPNLKVLSYLRNPKTELDGTTIKRDGNKYYVQFPSGTRVDISAYIHGTHTGYLNVKVQAPSDDLGNTEGLCGTFDHNPNNDFKGRYGTIYNPKDTIPTNFTNTWTVKPSESLFDKIPLYNPNLTPKHHYCQCKNGTATCGNGVKNLSNKLCASKKCQTIVPPPKKQGRRAAYDPTYNDDYHDDDLPVEIHQPQTVIRKRATVPTANGITRQSAQQKCYDALRKSSLHNHCVTSPLVDTDSFVDSCVEDMMTSGSDIFVLGTVDSLDGECTDVIMRNVSNFKVDQNGDLVLPEIVTTFYCPNQCSLKGQCVNGTCVCNPGFTSEDCSVKAGIPPEILRIRGNSLCDIRRHPCEQANMIASNLMDVPGLQCRYKDVTIVEPSLLPNYNGTYAVTSSPDYSVMRSHVGDTVLYINSRYHTSTAEFKSFLEAGCTLPPVTGWSGEIPAHGYMVSITTDSRHYSSEKMFLVYDGKCLQCNSTSLSCQIKNDTCLINGTCYIKGEENSEHQICNPSVSQTAWTDSPNMITLDSYTASPTGCHCFDDLTHDYDCACCRDGGCQCGLILRNKCIKCGTSDAECHL